jgi:hypothetical protein
VARSSYLLQSASNHRVLVQETSRVLPGTMAFQVKYAGGIVAVPGQVSSPWRSRHPRSVVRPSSAFAFTADVSPRHDQHIAKGALAAYSDERIEDVAHHLAYVIARMVYDYLMPVDSEEVQRLGGQKDQQSKGEFCKHKRKTLHKFFVRSLQEDVNKGAETLHVEAVTWLLQNRLTWRWVDVESDFPETPHAITMACDVGRALERRVVDHVKGKTAAIQEEVSSSLAKKADGKRLRWS